MQPNLYSGPTYAGMRIGLLGGSFNPAHDGHREMSLHALKRLGLDQVWWLVSPQNPLKPEKGMAPLATRLERARTKAHHPKIAVTDIESDLGTRYTVDTLRELHKRFPQVRFVWLMGADNLKQLPRWRNWTEIFDLVRIAVFRRPGTMGGYGMGKAAIRFAKDIKPIGREFAAGAAPGWLVLDNRLNLLSATAIRRLNP